MFLTAVTAMAWVGDSHWSVGSTLVRSADLTVLLSFSGLEEVYQDNPDDYLFD